MRPERRILHRTAHQALVGKGAHVATSDVFAALDWKVAGAAAVDFWARAIAPSNELRRWYQHAPEKWPEFRKRYFAELDANSAGVAELRAHLGRGTVTLLFSSEETELNNATALREYVETRSLPAQ